MGKRVGAALLLGHDFTLRYVRWPRLRRGRKQFDTKGANQVTKREQIRYSLIRSATVGADGSHWMKRMTDREANQGPPPLARAGWRAQGIIHSKNAVFGQLPSGRLLGSWQHIVVTSIVQMYKHIMSNEYERPVRDACVA
jgi:hypothetical protein